jgi:hypothetical protein
MNTLDFLIIGAQKSATTALFKYLQSHHAIDMPADKEAPLFTDAVDEASLQTFMATHFSNSDASRIRGKATPQYMCDAAVPARIKAHNPDIKLIAILREPVDRAWSQYRMNRRRKTETRSFDTAVKALLAPQQLARARAGKAPMHAQHYEPEGDYYLAWSEYGRILDGYLAHFAPQQLLVLFTQDIEHQPAEPLDRGLAFLGLEPGFRPSGFGEVVHKGGDSQIISKRVKDAIRHLAPVRFIWNRVPEARKQVLRYWFEQRNVRTSNQPVELEAATWHALHEHFAADNRRLEAITGLTPPWSADRPH